MSYFIIGREREREPLDFDQKIISEGKNERKERKKMSIYFVPDNRVIAI